MSNEPRIVVDPSAHDGRAMVSGTRVSVEMVLELFAEGRDEAEIQARLGIAVDDVRACAAHAVALLSRMRTPTRENAADRIAALKKRASELARSTPGVTEGEILDGTRTRSVAAARRAIFVALFSEGWSIAEVGRGLGYDHTTVIAGMRKAMGDDAYEAALEARYPGWRKLSRRAPSSGA